MIAHFFLWMYPKNVKLVRSRFNICLHYLQGSKLWCWSKTIAALKEKKIVCSSDLYSNDTAIILLTVDCMNFSSWEKKHPTLNKDPRFFYHKHNSCGYKYEIAVMVYETKIAWIKGPIRCGKGDHDVF